MTPSIVGYSTRGRGVYCDELDDATLTCLGEAERGADPRDTQLKCIKQVIDLQFR